MSGRGNRVVMAVAAAAMLSIGLVAVAPPAAAHPTPPRGPWVVNSASDNTDYNRDNGVCADKFGKCTLRAAIDEAKFQLAAGQDALISFAPALDRARILIGAALTISVPSSRLLTIQGPSSADRRPILDGAGSERILDLTGAGRALVGNLILENGKTLGGASDGGGAIRSSVRLTAAGTTIRNNRSLAGHGGGLLSTGSLTVLDSEIRGNTAGGNGGGVTATAASQIVRTVIAGNVAAADGGGAWLGTGASIEQSLLEGNNTGGSGGGVAFAGNSIAIDRTTIRDNRAGTGSGGGLSASDPALDDFSVAAVNTTIAGNSSSTNGGALRVADKATTRLENVTVSGNEVRAGQVGLQLGAPGLAGHVIRNSIVFGTVSAAGAKDCSAFGYETSGTDSIIGSGDCAPQNGGERLAVDPLLGPFDVYGGVTLAGRRASPAAAGTADPRRLPGARRGDRLRAHRRPRAEPDRPGLRPRRLRAEPRRPRLPRRCQRNPRPSQSGPGERHGQSARLQHPRFGAVRAGGRRQP